MKITTVFIFAVLILLMVSCSSEDVKKVDQMDNLTAADDFMFNTTVMVELELLSTKDNEPFGQAYFEIFDAMPGNNGKLVLQGYTDENGDFSHNLMLSSYLNSVFLINENRDFFELDINRLDHMTASIDGEFNVPYSSSSREAPNWNYNTSPYYSTIFCVVYNDNENLWTNDTDDMFGCYLGNTCIGVSGGTYPGATIIPNNRLLFTTIMYLPNTSEHMLNFRYYDASENTVYLMEDWYSVTGGTDLGNNQDPIEFYYGSWNMMPDQYILSCSSPGVGEYGMLAFEDNWPRQGDYDINDLVVYGNFTYYVEEMQGMNFSGDYEITYKIAAVGASYVLGFGIQLPEFFTVTSLSSTNGLAYLEEDNRTIIFADNVRDCIPGASGSYINTNESSPYFNMDYEKVTFQFDINYEYRVFMPPWNEPPYNPFIFVENERSHEIHPADYPPTASADLSQLGIFDDNSIPEQNRYYRTINNMPWVFMLPIEAPYPIERASIIDAFPRFDDWVENPWDNEDWYLDQPGNRNQNFLYSPPGD